MKKINAALIALGIFILTLNACKKDADGKVSCETKVQYIVNNYPTQMLLTRFNSEGRTVSVATQDEEFTYSYKNNEVAVRSDGRKIFNITLQNGRAVRVDHSGSNTVEKISYDSEGRMSQILLESGGVAGNTYTFNYVNGNLDYVLEQVGGSQLSESKFSFEYTDLKPNARTSYFQAFFNMTIGNSMPLTLLGSGSVNLPSKMIYSRKNNTNYEISSIAEYNYISSPDGKITSVNIKHTQSNQQGGEIILNQVAEITSGCD